MPLAFDASLRLSSLMMTTGVILFLARGRMISSCWGVHSYFLPAVVYSGSASCLCTCLLSSTTTAMLLLRYYSFTSFSHLK